MRAAVLRKLRTPLRIEKLARPEPGPGEILIRVAACGVCHSDLHAVDGDWTPGPTLPLIPGHEVTGHVAALGSGVSGVKLGEAVGVPWMFSACGACEYCLSGQETICRNGRSTGYSVPGGYAEFMVAPAAFVGRLPKNADLFTLAPILCAGVTTYRVPEALAGEARPMGDGDRRRRARPYRHPICRRHGDAHRGRRCG
jgi:propanol-preferring alcohol dehydrogenase